MIIGLTGGSGTGKSSASRFFEKNGFIIIDFDALSKKVSTKGSKCLDEIREVFGDEVFAPDGTLMRRTLGDIVFSDKKKLSILTSVTHKYILKECDILLKEYEGKNIIFDAPLLFEADLHKKCDYTIAICADEDIRTERIALRDGISKESAKKRIESQKDDNFYIEKSDFTVYNNEGIDSLCAELKNILRSITDESDSK